MALQIETLAIYGVGLIGGSVGLAAKSRAVARRVVGIGRSSERLAAAIERGAIDQATTCLEEGCARADMVVLASTVSHIRQTLARVAEACNPTALVTDVGSTKATIASQADRVFPRNGPFFVGSHPMAGGERSGVAHASADLFENACCIVTPTDPAPSEAVERVEQFWSALGARVVRLDPERHDRLVSAISHLPHLAAVGVLLAVMETGENEGLLASVIGNGFKDSTRIAAGSEQVWSEICLENRGPIAADLERLTSELLSLASQIRSGDARALADRLQRAREFRNRLVP